MHDNHVLYKIVLIRNIMCINIRFLITKYWRGHGYEYPASINKKKHTKVINPLAARFEFYSKLSLILPKLRPVYS